MSEELTKMIVVASEQGNLDQVQSALNEGADPNAMGAHFGALHAAVFCGHEAIVALLLEAGADPTIKDNRGYYPLHLAASKGSLDICALLIKAGADLDAVTSAGGTALHIAAVANLSPVLTALVNAGADLEIRDENGLTALASAASLACHQAVVELLKLGADGNTKDNGADTPLIKALRHVYKARVKGWSNEKESVRYEIINGCFRYNDNYDANHPTKLGKVLSIEKQRDYTMQDWGPAQHMHYLNGFDTVLALLESELDVNVVNDSGQTAMEMACYAGEAKLIALLHEKGAAFDNKDCEEATPLQRVAGSGRIDGLEMYFKLAKGVVDINVVDKYGWTALHYLADVGGHLSMAHLLLEKGADASLVSTLSRGDVSLGASPVDVALHWKDDAIAEVLKTSK